MVSPLNTAYLARLGDGLIQPDGAQAEAISHLIRLEADLAKQAEPGLLGFRRQARSLRGIYLFGPVGRGKSMLMDMLFESVVTRQKMRVHFHAFMARTHSLIRIWREASVTQRKAVFGLNKGDDPISPVARLLASEASLICFDEFQVTDIADAMILGRLFEALFEAGVTLVATSNRHPDDLYLNGLNRQLFFPTIAMLKSRMDVVNVAGDTDYRLARLKLARTWLSPNDQDHQGVFDRLWKDLVGGEPEDEGLIEVLGRELVFPRTCGRMLRCDFEDLCAAALGPQDYLAIAERFHTLFLANIPRLPPSKRDQAKRFNTLIDALYEARTHLVATAESAPSDLYPQGDGSFEFERTISRLEEMQSASWLEQPAQ
jgi:cell division protein ZapE